MRLSSIKITLTATLLMVAFVHAAPVGDTLKSAGSSVLGGELSDGLNLNGIPDVLGDGFSNFVYASADIGAQNGKALKRRNENEPDENEPDENEPKEDENEPDELGDEAPTNH